MQDKAKPLSSDVLNNKKSRAERALERAIKRAIKRRSKLSLWDRIMHTQPEVAPAPDTRHFVDVPPLPFLPILLTSLPTVDPQHLGLYIGKACSAPLVVSHLLQFLEKLYDRLDIFLCCVHSFGY